MSILILSAGFALIAAEPVALQSSSLATGRRRHEPV
jgi:hypothetical protein